MPSSARNECSRRTRWANLQEWRIILYVATNVRTGSRVEAGMSVSQLAPQGTWPAIAGTSADG